MAQNLRMVGLKCQSTCYGLSCVPHHPSEDHVETLTPNVTAFGDRAFNEAINKVIKVGL